MGIFTALVHYFIEILQVVNSNPHGSLLVPILFFSVRAHGSRVAGLFVTAADVMATETVVPNAPVSPTAEEVRHLLASLRQYFGQISSNRRVIFGVVKRAGPAVIAHPASSTNTMNVFVDAFRQVIVYDVGHVGYVQTPGSDGGGNQHFHFARLEIPQRLLPLALQPIPVDRSSRMGSLGHERGEKVGVPLRLHKDERALGIGLVQELLQFLTLFKAAHFVNSLVHVRAGATDNTDRDENIIAKEFICEPLNLLGESCGEHQSLVRFL